jgi:hypothetical protein
MRNQKTRRPAIRKPSRKTVQPTSTPNPDPLASILADPHGTLCDHAERQLARAEVHGRGILMFQGALRANVTADAVTLCDDLFPNTAAIRRVLRIASESNNSTYLAPDHAERLRNIERARLTRAAFLIGLAAGKHLTNL